MDRCDFQLAAIAIDRCDFQLTAVAINRGSLSSSPAYAGIYRPRRRVPIELPVDPSEVGSIVTDINVLLLL